MTGRARTALWLLKPKVSLAAPTTFYPLSGVLLGSSAWGRRVWERDLLGSQRASRHHHNAGSDAKFQRSGVVRPAETRYGSFAVRARLNALCWSCQSRHLASEQNRDEKDQRARPKLVESTRKLREQVQSRLANLTPHENIYTVPNILTFSRLLAAPAIGYLVLHDQHAWAVALFAYAGITDLVDGYIARHWKLQTVVGSVIDPMADKALMFILTVCLAAKAAIPRRFSKTQTTNFIRG